MNRKSARLQVCVPGETQIWQGLILPCSLGILERQACVTISLGILGNGTLCLLLCCSLPHCSCFSTGCCALLLCMLGSPIQFRYLSLLQQQSTDQCICWRKASLCQDVHCLPELYMMGCYAKNKIPELTACWCSCQMYLEVHVCTRSDYQT